ncbi:MAG: hypothetical protein K9H48_07905 [Melioribacteraceae bacterium]|nr:hypothetical protein [Melioribacteraceae bacterium]
MFTEPVQFELFKKRLIKIFSEKEDKKIPKEFFTELFNNQIEIKELVLHAYFIKMATKSFVFQDRTCYNIDLKNNFESVYILGYDSANSSSHIRMNLNRFLKECCFLRGDEFLRHLEKIEFLLI